MLYVKEAFNISEHNLPQFLEFQCNLHKQGGKSSWCIHLMQITIFLIFLQRTFTTKVIYNKKLTGNTYRNVH